VIEDVEKVRSELQVNALAKIELTAQGEIRLEEWKSEQRVSSQATLAYWSGSARHHRHRSKCGTINSSPAWRRHVIDVEWYSLD
jgi:G3E family GTPase